MTKVSKAIDIYRNEGITSLCQAIFTYLWSRPAMLYATYLRSLSPSTDKEIKYNGVRVRPYRTTDTYVPFSLPPNKGGHEDPANYEYGLAKSLREKVTSGDSVVIVGGGLGVTAVIAAREAGTEGEVIVYEGAANMVDHIEETIKLNKPPCPIKVTHSIVSSVHRLDGRSGDATIVKPDDLPDCDVLELDCEGAESEILSDLAIQPDSIIVETHGNRDEIIELLQRRGYEITDENIAERDQYRTMCEKNGIYVLSADVI